MLSQHSITCLMRGEALQILDYRCADGQPASSEEWATAFEIDLPRTGAYIRRSSYGRDLAEASSAIFFRKGQLYDIQHPLGGGDRTTVFVLDEKVFGEFVGGPPRGGNRPPPDVFPVGSMRITSREQALHHALLRALAAGHSTDPLLVQEIAFTLMRELLLRAHADDYNRDSLPQTKDAERSDLAERVKLHLIGRLDESVSLESLAGHTNYSPSYLAHMFRRTTGMTIHRTLVRLRLAEAIERIADLPDRNLAELALDLGFSSHSHFTYVFSREFGFPPSAFSRKGVSGALRALGRRRALGESGVDRGALAGPPRFLQRPIDHLGTDHKDENRPAGVAWSDVRLAADSDARRQSRGRSAGRSFPSGGRGLRCGCHLSGTGRLTRGCRAKSPRVARGGRGIASLKHHPIRRAEDGRAATRWAALGGHTGRSGRQCLSQ